MRSPKPIPTEQRNVLKGCLKRAKTKVDFQRIQCLDAPGLALGILSLIPLH